MRWRSRTDGRIVDLEWSWNGSRLVARRAGARDDVAVYTRRGALLHGLPDSCAGSLTAVATRPGATRARWRSGRAQARLLMPDVLRARSRALEFLRI